MKIHGEKVRYSSFCFFQDAFSCLVILFLSFPKFIKTAFDGSFRLEQSYEYIPVYPSLQTESIASSCTFDFDRDFSLEAHDVKGHPCEPHETSVNSVSTAPNLGSPSIPSQASTNHYNCLLSSMIFLRNITSTSPNLMENPNISLLRKIYKPLSISLTFLR